jgi:dienelactone hydrolase
MTLSGVNIFLLLLLPIIRVAGAAPSPKENLELLDFWKIYSDAPNALYKDLVADALKPLKARQEAVARLRSREDWQRYRTETRGKLLDVIGPFPEKTPLNARTLGVVKKDGFRVEKVVYESQPGLFVTAGLFVPEPLRARAPAIVYCSGHVTESFRSRGYQHVVLNLVKRGFIVLAFDPIGQGERLQFFNTETGRAEFGPALGHSHGGAPSFILDGSIARLMIWDGIRSIDYLVSRDEVDPRRLGITGRSGGGTQSAYIAAMDERIVAAAPECYITSFEQLLKSRGPQDAEQNFYNGIASGLDQADLLIARAPKPTLILATSRDIFSIEGTQTVSAELQRAYAALGQEQSFSMSVDDAEHESTRKNREATYAFFQHHLELPGDSADLSVERLTPEELRITETGQLATSLRGETLPSLNRRDAVRLRKQLEERRRNLAQHLQTVRTDAARLAGYNPPAATAQEAVFSGRYRRDGYAVEKYLLPVDDRYAIPLLAMVPDSGAPARVVLYLHPEGKAAAAEAGGEMEWFVRQGCAVVAPDIIGTGELGPGYLMDEGGQGQFRTWFGYVLMGKSIVGRQMTDVIRTSRFIEKRFGVAPTEIAGVSRGAFAPLLLHTAALESEFERVALLAPMVSYHSLASSELYPVPDLIATVPAALTAYDLPDLAACHAKGKLLLVDPRGGNGAGADAALIEQETAVITRAFAAGGNPADFKVIQTRDDGSLHLALAEWLK